MGKSRIPLEPISFLSYANNSSTTFLKLFAYLDKSYFIFCFVSAQIFDMFLWWVTYDEEKVNRKFYKLKGLVLLRISGPRLPDLVIDCVF